MSAGTSTRITRVNILYLILNTHMNIKKIIASVVAVAMVATQAMTSIASVSAANVNPEWVEAVNFMKTEGLSSVASSVEAYMPLATVTREQAAKFFVAFAEKEFGKTADTTLSCTFADINKAKTLGNRKQYRWMGRLEQVRETTLCIQRTKHVCVWLFPLYGFPPFAMAILFAWVQSLNTFRGIVVSQLSVLFLSKLIYY